MVGNALDEECQCQCQPCMPHCAPCFRHRRNSETLSYIHQRLQNSKNSGRLARHNATSIAAIPHEGKFFKRQKFVVKISQQYFGRPMRLCPPRACQDNKAFLIHRCPGSVAKYCAKFQWCRRKISDHDLDPVCEVKARTRSFQMWIISCHGTARRPNH